MMVHLQYNHRVEFLKVKAKASTATQARSASQKSNKQPCITESFEQLQPIPQSSKKWKALTNSVCQYIAKDMMPFSTVSNVGFQKILHTFEPRYVLPDRKTITQHYMPEIYEQVKSNVTEAMKRDLVYFSLTTDAWTSRANHSYITHTVHHINELWDLCCHVLDTTEITRAYSS